MKEVENYFVRLQIFSRPQSNFEESIINHDNHNANENDQQSSETHFNGKPITCLKKRVRFADACGEALETVCAIEDLPNNMFNIKSRIFGRHKYDTKLYDFFNQLSLEEFPPSGDEKTQFYSNFKNTPAIWKIDFIQPASEYLKFRETLEKNKIALENVILRNDSGKMLGTIKVMNISILKIQFNHFIKVANLSLQKNVFLRFTTDAWKSFIDCPGTYESSYIKPYDTFAFETDIPKNEGEINKIEICVCYIADGGIDFWDSNNGQNYSLISKKS